MKMMGYELLGIFDLVLVGEDPGTTHSLVAYFEIEKSIFQLFKQEFMRRGVQRISKLQSIRINILGFFFWKQMHNDFTNNQIIEISKKFNIEKDCVKYCNEIILKQWDMSKPLWEVHFCQQYKHDSSVFFIKMHHTLTDSIGFVSFMSCILDKECSLTMKKKFEIVGPVMKQFYRVASIPYCTYKTMLMRKLSSDPETKKINVRVDHPGVKNKFYCSEEFPFDKIMK
jgi:hypothetical protein